MTRTRKPSGKKPLFHVGRAEGAYRRPAGRRLPQRIILVLCEGSKTEPGYFRALKAVKRLRTVHVEVIPGGEERTNPMNLVKAACRERIDRDCTAELDQVWCVFDTERKGTYSSLESAIHLAQKEGIHLAMSNPAFEYWYLLHYEYTSRPFLNAEAVIAVLYKHIPQYHKSMAVFQCLGERTPQALLHAMQLRGQDEHGWLQFPNPSTSVDQLVQEIWQLDPSGSNGETGA